jgi:hypothetical protein
MSSNLSDPCPHAVVYTSFASPIVLNPQALGGVMISNFQSGVSTATFTTVGGEVITLTAASNAQASGPVFLPIQVAVINTASNIGAITALWH